MGERRTEDRQPGPLPQIMACKSVTFDFARIHNGASLIIRCDDHGTLWASVGTDGQS
jgi:hypothetical protein